jgi:hypothetical protein
MSEHIESPTPRRRTVTQLAADVRKLRADLERMDSKAAAATANAAQRSRSAAVREIRARVDLLAQQVNAATASAAEVAKVAHRSRAARRYHERKVAVAEPATPATNTLRNSDGIPAKPKAPFRLGQRAVAC